MYPLNSASLSAAVLYVDTSPTDCHNQESVIVSECFNKFIQNILFFQGDLSAVRELLDRGDNPNVRDNAGWTPLVRLSLFTFSLRTAWLVLTRALTENVDIASPFEVKIIV